METTKKTNSEQQAEAQLDSILELVKALEAAGDDDEKREAAEEAIQEDVLAVEVRSDWHTLDQKADKPTEYRILLCWGGPAVQIVGELNEHGEPETARIEHQDWGTFWTGYRIDSETEETILKYVRCFYFGE